MVVYEGLRAASDGVETLCATDVPTFEVVHVRLKQPVYRSVRAETPRLRADEVGADVNGLLLQLRATAAGGRPAELPCSLFDVLSSSPLQFMHPADDVVHAAGKFAPQTVGCGRHTVRRRTGVGVDRADAHPEPAAEWCRAERALT